MTRGGWRPAGRLTLFAAAAVAIALLGAVVAGRPAAATAATASHTAVGGVPFPPAATVRQDEGDEEVPTPTTDEDEEAAVAAVADPSSTPTSTPTPDEEEAAAAAAAGVDVTPTPTPTAEADVTPAVLGVDDGEPVVEEKGGDNGFIKFIGIAVAVVVVPVALFFLIKRCSPAARAPAEPYEFA